MVVCGALSNASAGTYFKHISSSIPARVRGRVGFVVVLSIFGLFPFTDHQRLVVLSKDLENKTNFNG